MRSEYTKCTEINLHVNFIQVINDRILDMQLLHGTEVPLSSKNKTEGYNLIGQWRIKSKK